MKARIELTDTTEAALFKISEANPGALSVCIKILTETEKIDPDNGLGGLGVILTLDGLDIYGSKIWMLYNDVCGQRLSCMLAVLRGFQLGFVTRAQLLHAVENSGDGLNLEDIASKVAACLPRFNFAA